MKTNENKLLKTKKYNQNYYQKNKEKILEQTKNYRENNKDKIKVKKEERTKELGFKDWGQRLRFYRRKKNNPYLTIKEFLIMDNNIN